MSSPFVTLTGSLLRLAGGVTPMLQVDGSTPGGPVAAVNHFTLGVERRV